MPSSSSPFTVHKHDARRIGQLLDKALPDQHVMATVTSPPYFNLLDYGVKKQIGYGQRYSSYLDDCASVFGQIFERTSDEGSLWLIADTALDKSHDPSRLRNIPFDLAARCEQLGWVLREVIIWQKDKTRPWSRAGSLRNGFEYILYFVKSRDFKYRVDRVREPTSLASWWVRYPERYNPRGKAPDNVWNFAIPRQGSWSNSAIRHACPLPPNLIERILLLATDEGDIVCDPFAGSGTVIAEAERLGRLGVGSELNSDYVKAYRHIVRTEILERPRVNDLSKAKEQSDVLERTIEQLRAVKFARAAWHQYRVATPNSALLPTHVIARAAKAGVNAKAHHTQDVALYFVLDASPEERESVQAQIKQSFGMPPLSKYGIAGDVRVIPSTAVRGLFEGDSFWLYEHGNTWQHAGQVSLASLVGMSGSPRRMKYPPIAANICVDVDPASHPSDLGQKHS